MGNVFNWLFRESGKCFKPDSQGEWEMFLTGYSGRVGMFLTGYSGRMGNVLNRVFRKNGKWKRFNL